MTRPLALLSLVSRAWSSRSRRSGETIGDLVGSLVDLVENGVAHRVVVASDLLDNLVVAANAE
jgi:hypothetical protein